jgi:TolB-like protein/DNA-binding winged helix-turn-helix (wHTH) protein
MRLLVCLAERAGNIVSIDEVLEHVWPGVTVAPDSVYQAVASLRRILGDDPKQPTYIVTVPRLGYQLVASVERLDDSAARPESSPSSPSSPSDAGRRPYLLAGLAVALTAAVVLGVWTLGGASKNGEAATRTSARSAAPETSTSIAVLPFLDLTVAMKHEIFVDGMTEELVDKLSKIDGVRVPPARTSLSFKGKDAAIRDVAAALGTTYVLDGSVRQSGKALRVAARLVRADTGFVVWSETYDRSLGDLVAIENDIATEVARSLKIRVEGGS